MKNNLSWQRLWPHLVAVIGFIVLALVYVSPVLDGKKLNMLDDQHARAASREVFQYHDQTGEWSNWTNSMFGGMPAYLIGGDYPTSLPTKIGQFVNKVLPAPANYLVIGMISAYVLFLVLGAGGWIAAFGAIAFAFSSFNIVNLEAGHVSQIIAVMYAPGVIAGVFLAFRKNWLIGTAVTALFLSLELYANHVQITYYLGIAIIALVIIESIPLIKKGAIKQLAFILVGLGFAAVVSVGSHSTRLWNAYDYTKETIRGKSELTPINAPGKPAKTDGLDKDYAFQYSYGITEILTFVVPNAYGGASQGPLSTSSETYKVLTGRGVDAASAQGFVQQLPLYWGDQPIMGGPYYMGALVFFFFVLGLFIIRGDIKWWVAGITSLFIIWAWGKTVSGINDLFFDYFPMFNKFRAITMVISLAELMMLILAVVTLATIIQKKISWKDLQKPFLTSLGITAGLMLILAIVPTLFFNFQSANDGQILESFTQMTQDKGFAQQILNAIVQDRAGLMRADAFRSLVFILLGAGLVWLWMNNKIKPVLLYSALILLVIIDMFGIDKRYLNNDDFVTKFAAEEKLSPSAADQQILADKALDFRVLDLSAPAGPFNSADASYFHKSLGGYHGAKMRRYQELFERQIANQNANPDILNMLNTKYFITADEKGNKVAVPQQNPFGNAWFVSSYKIVPNADAEMNALGTLKPRQEAVIDQRFASKLQGLTLHSDSTDVIRLTDYKPNVLTYESNSKSEGLAVFSEIYYNVRDEWQVTIDGKPAEMIRANYVLRALRVPAGKHTIVFQFRPVSVAVGKNIDLVSSILLIGLLVGACFLEMKKKPEAKS